MEALRAVNDRLCRPNEHIERLFAAASLFEIVIPFTGPELIEAIDATLQANNRTDGYVRVIVSRGPGTLGPDPRKIDPQVIIIAEEYHPFPQEIVGNGLHAVTAQFPVNVANPLAYCFRTSPAWTSCWLSSSPSGGVPEALLRTEGKR